MKDKDAESELIKRLIDYKDKLKFLNSRLDSEFESKKDGLMKGDKNRTSFMRNFFI